MRKYVFHIQSKNQGEGCGFFLGGFFYTCAHVVEICDNPYIVVDSKKVPLGSPVFLRYDEKNSEGYDIAVFNLPIVESPLAFVGVWPAAGECLDSISWRTVPQGSEFVSCRATVRAEQENNYFFADTDVNLCEGSSGSPLVRGGKVYGMLCAGEPGGSLCAFLSAESILKLLNL